MKNGLLLTLVILSLCVLQAIGQDQPLKAIKVKRGLQVILRDTTFITKRDTTLLLDAEAAEKLRIRENPLVKSSRFYDSLKEKTSGSKVTRDIYDMIVKRKKRKEKLVNVIVKSEEMFEPYAGDRIGSIVFKSVDLLEGSVIDTLQKATTKFGKFVNKVHRDTRAQIIKKNLLFKVGDVVDPFKLADNERILRQFKTLRDARIYLHQSNEDVNVVDVVVVTQDVASIGASGSYSSPRNFRIDVYDINILGYAKQLQVSYFRNLTGAPENGYEITLREQNLWNTFIQGEIQYTNNYIRERARLEFGRDFFTPEIKYAGGIVLFRTHENFYARDYDTLGIPYNENHIDVWAGRSLELRKRVNLIFSARVNPRNFTNTPYISADSNSFFFDRTLWLGSISMVKRNFLKTLRIRGFGKTEDLPIGGGINFLFGKESNEFIDRSYFELNGTFGSYFQKLGYINVSAAVGSFFRSGSAEDGVIATTGTYFTDLIRLRKTQMRQFLFFTYMRGVNRVLDPSISLTGKWEDSIGIPPLGDRRTTIGLETVYFMPWYTYGFQFALFYRADLNIVSNSSSLFDTRSAFYSIRAGARMLNENLVFPAISLELAYYGKNENYNGAWEFKISTSLPNLFGTSQVFKPEVVSFE